MIDFTDSPEIMGALQRAMLAAAQSLDLRELLTSADPEDIWLTSREAMAYLRWKERKFQLFKKEHPEKLVVSLSLGLREPRYQLAALHRLMRERVVGLPEGEATASGAKTAGAPAPGKSQPEAPVQRRRRDRTLQLFP